MEALWPVAHEKFSGETVDSNGYTVPESWAAPVKRMVYGWQPELVDVTVDVAFQMRVTNRQVVGVPDIRLYGLGDRLALGFLPSEVDDATPKHRVDQIQDLAHGPFQTVAFGPAPGGLVVEYVSG